VRTACDEARRSRPDALRSRANHSKDSFVAINYLAPSFHRSPPTFLSSTSSGLDHRTKCFLSFFCLSLTLPRLETKATSKQTNKRRRSNPKRSTPFPSLTRKGGRHNIPFVATRTGSLCRLHSNDQTTTHDNRLDIALRSIIPQLSLSLLAITSSDDRTY
jgi:hypothetical protein